jgi:hypothetical protein
LNGDKLLRLAEPNLDARRGMKFAYDYARFRQAPDLPGYSILAVLSLFASFLISFSRAIFTIPLASS